jgi:hypothetical protein
MGSRSFRYALALILIVLAAMTIRPCIEYRLYAATTPRPVEVRGSLADYENSAIEVFERVSPSVVQVVGRSGANELSPFGGDEAGIRTGTGFIWDQAGHVVTNDHVAEGTKVLAARLASGEAVKATIVGLAPHYQYPASSNNVDCDPSGAVFAISMRCFAYSRQSFASMMKPPMQPLRAQRGRMRAWLCRDCELDPAGIDALGGPGRNGPGVAGARHPACLDPAALGSGQGHPTSVEP